jgi:transposase
VVNWVQEAGERLGPTLEQVETLLLRSKVAHVDETGGHLAGVLHWFHVFSNKWLTIYHWHRKRGQEGMKAIGLLPGYHGRIVRDRWKSYDEYPCQQSLCGAHLLRDCVAVAELEGQPWAQQMHDLLLELHRAVHQARAAGQEAFAPQMRDDWIAQYFEVLQQGYHAWNQAHPPPDPDAPKKRGRPKQDAGKNLLDALLSRAEQVLAFVDDFTVPFTNNLAERDLRMIKVQQKISGTFRSEAGATSFCAIRSYLSTMRKQGRSLLESLTALFQGTPFSIAWEPGS